MNGVYTCTDHDYVWPVGVASIVIANTEEDAIALLDAELKFHGLKGFKESPYTLKRLNLTEQKAIVLLDGDY